MATLGHPWRYIDMLQTKTSFIRHVGLHHAGACRGKRWAFEHTMRVRYLRADSRHVLGNAALFLGEVLTCLTRQEGRTQKARDRQRTGRGRTCNSGRVSKRACLHR